MAPRLRSGNALRRHQSGFSFLLVLLLVVLMGIGLGAAGTFWSTESQRVKEAELLFSGEEYRKAIRSYYGASPGEAKHYPKKLDDLLLDTRQIKLTRHLRKLYRDPVTGKNDWGLVIDPVSEEISGVYSRAPGQPLKQQGFGPQQKEFADAVSYEAWRFFVAPEDVPPPTGAPKTSSETGPVADTN